MKSLYIGAAALVFATAATSVRAADLAPVEAPVAPVITEVSGIYDWNGFYVGAMTGYDWTEADTDDGGVSASPGLDGWALGGYTGYNYQMGSWVMGLEGDVKYDWNSDKFDLGGIPMELETNWSGSLRARVGYAFDRTLVYGTGGYAFTNAELRDRETGDSDKKTFNGWTIGAGLEHAFTDNLIGRAEYRYTDYGDKNLMGVNTDLSSNSLMLGVGWKF
ncbi:outer membrane immunogenic protein [Mycoplana sp. BE70]|uniref:outer membrane protein n=1 Tax=Mycoplana sp. BE70 TaxID=2817775 RepID=UPI0028574D23|nr:porin family protein [Mycoplana sp. BE70]MDR6756659.1 outer membrane immunogenic protein [Mycoplana sp. BE70]